MEADDMYDDIMDEDDDEDFMGYDYEDDDSVMWGLDHDLGNDGHLYWCDRQNTTFTLFYYRF